ncbi:hypothetical protein UIB01_09980 [Stutzerimonas decontaminans]|uniref:Uncharacterized protein n=1 Tax=Stutzerimonas stutzeri TaxID=316 RepID=A0A023WYU3_STUST|nr:hypothetical protein UIB01_09980 [Stutzerimonas decontaminans]
MERYRWLGGRQRARAAPKDRRQGRAPHITGMLALAGTPGLATDGRQCLYKQRYSRIQHRKRYPGAKPVSPEAIASGASRKLDARLDMPTFEQCIHIGCTQWLVRHAETERQCVHWPGCKSTIQSQAPQAGLKDTCIARQDHLVC